MFIQIIQGTVVDADALQRSIARWRTEIKPGAHGYQGSTGGVTPETVPSLATAGARHFVVVRYLTEAADPRRSATQLRASIEEHVADASP